LTEVLEVIHMQNILEQAHAMSEVSDLWIQWELCLMCLMNFSAWDSDIIYEKIMASAQGSLICILLHMCEWSGNIVSFAQMQNHPLRAKYSSIQPGVLDHIFQLSLKSSALLKSLTENYSECKKFIARFEIRLMGLVMVTRNIPNRQDFGIDVMNIVGNNAAECLSLIT
jgi:hypothetical protein